MRTRWYLTQAAMGQPEVGVRDHDGDEDLTRGYSLLRELAADPRGGLLEIRAGLFIESKSLTPCEPSERAHAHDEETP